MSGIVLAGSLAAILLMWGVARLLGLGGDARIEDAGQAMRMAAEAEAGFEPVEAAVDRDGRAALVRGADGRHMLIRRHGAMFAGRILGATCSGRLDRRSLTLRSDDRMFGPVTLDLGTDAAVWARRLGVPGHG